MSQQIQITGGAKVRNLEGVLTGTAGVVNALGINVANGIPRLDSNAKILVSQLPNSVMEYKGTWNAATNTPTLVNGTGNQGDVYLVSVAGTVNFGAGPITFAVGDQAIYSGTIWQKAGGSTGTVTSVAVTETGDALTITGSPITTSGTINIGFAGTSGQYVNGAGGLTTFPSLAGYVTAVTGTAPIVSSGGTTPAISIPVATASVDGYLDNADWTTFNNKQNAITLTTTGTSGASTLVGSTLNIPNYSTDLSGYVPYTGATANLDLGTFDLTTDIINLNQLKAIGSGGLNIYSNSGTHIALMGGGGGAGTTFYGGIIGTTASFASSGGSDTFAINHSSGSGIALNITKGGAGEGLYINKTSGSGNAATIIGTLNATTLVKSGGTSSQFLKADGSVDSNTYLTTSSAASTYVPYTGATTDIFLGAYGLTARGLSSGGIGLSQSTSSSGTGATYINGTSTGLRINPNASSFNNFAFPASATNTYTYPNATGTIALTSDIPSLSGYIQGSGTTNYVPKFTASGTIGNSIIYDLGTRIAIGGTSAADGVLTVQSDAGQFCIQSNTTPGKQLQIGYDHVSNNSYLSSLQQGVAFTTLALQPNGGNVHIGGSTSNGSRLQVTGTATFSSSVQATNMSIGISPQTDKLFVYNASGTNTGITIQQDGTGDIFRANGNSGANRFVVQQGGNVGIGTSSPTERVSIVGTGLNTQHLLLQSTASSANAYLINKSASKSYITGLSNDFSNSYIIYDETAAALRMSITSGGVLLVNSTSTVSYAGVNMQITSDILSRGSVAGYFFENRSGGVTSTSNWYGWYATGGTIYLYNGSGNIASINTSSGAYTALSDINKKKDFEVSTIGLNAILGLKPTLYRMKDEDESVEKHLGFIAQEVKEFIPQAYIQTKGEKEDFIGLDDRPIIAALVKAIQEQQAQIEELKAKIK